MSYFRSYFEKNNTIIKDSSINTAKNPNTEIMYGPSFSKFIFKIDLTDLQNKINSGEYVVDENTKHTLHLTNTIFGDEALLGDDRGNSNIRATSFDLILFKVPQSWDEGVGFDYEKVYDLATGEQLFDNRPSNWFNRTTLDTWNDEGIYTTFPIVITTIHFDNGNEDISVDITNYINNILVNGDVDHGLGLAFSVPYQEITIEKGYSVSFFSKYTQTFFEPYLETYFQDVIEDDRQNFVAGVEQNLYLYVTKGTNFYDLDVLPTVDILDSTKTPITNLTDIETVKIRKGVYKISFGINGILCDGKKFFYDKWKGIEIDGVSLGDITQKFVPKPYTSQYTIGENQTELQRYAIQYFGVKLNEKIKRDEKRKIVVTFRSIDEPKTVLLDEVYYRIFIKEGRTQVNVLEWSKLDRTNENSFVLDTSYFIPREYFLEIKGKTHTEEIFYKDIINFEIVSEK
jgi:hypothetical protein